MAKHCDDYIDDMEAPYCLRRFLRYARWPAHYQIKAKAMGVRIPELYANYNNRTVRVTMASCIGDVGITTDLDQETGYSKRVMLEFLKDFSHSPFLYIFGEEPCFIPLYP